VSSSNLPHSSSPSGSRRLPEGRLDKARAYLELGKADLEAGRLQSAESFLRLAAAWDPASLAIKALIKQVVARRGEK